MKYCYYHRSLQARLAKARQQLEEVRAQQQAASQMEEEVMLMKHQMAAAAGATSRSAAPAANGSAGGASDGSGAEAATAAGTGAEANSVADGADGVGGAARATGAEAEGVDAEEAVMAAHLSSVRAQHAALMQQREELLRLTAESELLLRDNELLKMQLNVAVAMYGSAAAGAATGGDSGSASGLATPIARAKSGAGGVSGELAEVAENGEEEAGAEATVASGASEGGGSAEGTTGAQVHRSASGASVLQPPPPSREMSADLGAGAAASGVSGPLTSVFQRIRVLEGEKLELQAANRQLMHELDCMRAALEVSMSRLDALRGLSQSINMIRGKKSAA